MRTHRRALGRSALAVALTLLLGACASAARPDSDLAMIRVQNDDIGPYVTVSLEPVDGTARALGIVREASAVTFDVPVREGINRFRLIAVARGDEDRDDHVVSQVVTLDHSEMITWFVDTNRIEDNNN